MTITIKLSEFSDYTGFASSRDYRIVGSEASRVQASAILAVNVPIIEGEVNIFRPSILRDYIKTSIQGGE